MKKTIRIIASAIVCLTTVCSNISVVSYGTDLSGVEYLKKISEKYSETTKQDLSDIDAQNDAQEAYSDIMEEVEAQTDGYEYYGGSYINDDGTLVVNVTTSSAKIKNEIQEDTTTQEVKFQKVKYSYEELMDLYNLITEKIESSNVKTNVTCFYVDEINNCIVVEIKDGNAVNDFKNEISDDHALTFKVVEG